MRLFLLSTLLVVLAMPGRAQEVAGLAGWSIYLDPGHSQNENVGVFGYSEARKNLRVGLNLRDLLLETTDIDAVHISRTNDQQQVSLSQRVDDANTTGADFYLSIHSNAAAPSANHLFVLWPQHRDGSEVAPVGGRAMAALAADALAEGMRIPTQGAIGECDFYGASSCRGRNLATGKGGSRNFVQSYTTMASALSEAGFHTNPTQNQRNMNADWKRLEARSIYWAILAFHGLPRPAKPILTGIVADLESGRPLNGAVVSVQDTGYVTDTFESLFRQYSNDPELLRNGFYYLEGLAAGEYVVRVEAPDYEPYEGVAQMADTTFTFHDVGLISTRPPVVASSSPFAGEDPFKVSAPIVIEFSRPMERASVEAALQIEPDVQGTVFWSNGDRRFTLTPDTLLPRTNYQITIGEAVRGAFDHPFDGDGDGAAGGDFTLAFVTGFPDTRPPAVTTSYPRVNARDVPLHPVLNLVYDEVLDSTSVEGRVHLEEDQTGARVPGRVRTYRIGERSVVTFFPGAPLAPATRYVLEVAPGVEDLFLNADPNSKRLRFTTGTVFETARRIDDFEEGRSNWWEPQQSGSTTGIATLATGVALDTSIVNGLFGSTAALGIDYGWDLQAADWLIRTYLGGGAPRAVQFDTTYSLRVYVFGDGSGTQFRFAVDDRVPAAAATNHEVSPWVPVDWFGWQPVTWDLSAGEVGAWLGDGVLDGVLRFDSIQLAYAAGAAAGGRLVFDDLQLVETAAPTGTETDVLPDGYVLSQNYPNPFNPRTTIDFALPEPGDVRLVVYDALGRVVRVLAEGMLPAGSHTAAFDAGMLPTGVYLYRLETPRRTLTKKMLLMR